MDILIPAIIGITLFLIKSVFYTVIINTTGKKILNIKNKNFKFKLIFQYLIITIIIQSILMFIVSIVGMDISYLSYIITPLILCYLLISQIKLNKKEAMILSSVYLIVSIVMTIIYAQLAIFYLKTIIFS